MGKFRFALHETVADPFPAYPARYYARVLWTHCPAIDHHRTVDTGESHWLMDTIVLNRINFYYYTALQEVSPFDKRLNF